MTRRRTNSRGADLATRLRQAVRRAEGAARPGTRQLPAVRGVVPSCVFHGRQENVLAAVRDILVESRKVFRYGNSIVVETGEGDERKLVPILTDYRVEPAATSILSNLFVCEIPPASEDDVVSQFPPPSRLIELVLNSDPTVATLPQVRMYSTRPVFDRNFEFRGPGWYPEQGILVHGPEIEPVLPPRANRGGAGLCHLPHHLQRLLTDFCLRDAADVANAIGAMLTGLLMPHFVARGKPVVLLDGNQPGLGKTLLARVLGLILDESDPRLIAYTTDDDELTKKICATLRGSQQSVLIVDNAKTRVGGSISSSVIESNSMAPELSLRILGQSLNYTRPNDLIWCVTMNDTRTSSDLASRGLPIRFHYDSNPKDRNFGGREPIEYVKEHRNEILGELAGMVVLWSQAGRPEGRRRHRCAHWGTIIGGILEANGMSEFLANLDEAAGEFDSTRDELAALAEACVELRGPAWCVA